jgi:hypothetical protein
VSAAPGLAKAPFSSWLAAVMRMGRKVHWGSTCQCPTLCTLVDVLDCVSVCALLWHQGGLGALAAEAHQGASLTCKDSVLVGWGGAVEHINASCPLVSARSVGTSLKLQDCVVQFHPDSRHPKPVGLLRAVTQGSTTASGCKLVGPAPGSCSERMFAAAAEDHGAISMVSSCRQLMLGHSAGMTVP